MLISYAHHVVTLVINPVTNRDRLDKTCRYNQGCGLVLEESTSCFGDVPMYALWTRGLEYNTGT